MREASRGLLTVGQAAAMYDVSRSKVRYWCDRDNDPLPHCRSNKPRSHRRIPEMFFRLWAQRHGWCEPEREADSKRHIA